MWVLLGSLPGGKLVELSFFILWEFFVTGVFFIHWKTAKRSLSLPPWDCENPSAIQFSTCLLGFVCFFFQNMIATSQRRHRNDWLVYKWLHFRGVNARNLSIGLCIFDETRTLFVCGWLSSTLLRQNRTSSAGVRRHCSSPCSRPDEPLEEEFPIGWLFTL